MKQHKQRITVLLFLTSLSLLLLFHIHNMDMFNKSLMINWELMLVSTNYITYSMILDKISLGFSAMVFLISGSVFMFSRWYMAADPFYSRFTWILLSFVLSMNFLIYSGSLLFLLVGWDGLGVTSFALIVYYQSNSSNQAGFLTLMINRIGDILIMSVMFYYTLAGSLLLVNYPVELTPMMLWLLGFAALTKSAQYPFSAWLPAAMAAPTPVSALVHSSTLVTAGIYIMIRAYSSMSVVPGLSNMLLFCGALTSLVGGLCASRENDIKKVVAFSTLSQLGIMVFCLGLGAPHLALLHLFAHAMFKAMLFLVAGYILMLAYGVQDIRLLGSVTKSHPMLLVILNTSSLCLMGVPFLSAYYSKHTIMNLMLSTSINLFAVIIMVVAVVYTSVYMVRVLKALNWGFSNNNLSSVGSMSSLKFIPCYVLFMGSLFLGWYFSVMDPLYMSSIFLPSNVSHIFDMLLPVSLVFSVFFFKSTPSLTLSSMFFMEPMWLASGRAGNFLSKNSKMFEYGWVEPYNFTYLSISKLLLYMNQFVSWPGKTYSYLKFVVISSSVL
uniref:NADH dehydrogenase subunit 5 n=1 Tax=Laeocathaica amdoana TaxID=2936362 RepID=UPI0022FD9A4D|nr:NADH dehydrogenase subunit 5 [Laeocathaica amdoana]